MLGEREQCMTGSSRFMPEGLHCPHFASPASERLALPGSLSVAAKRPGMSAPFLSINGMHIVDATFASCAYLYPQPRPQFAGVTLGGNPGCTQLDGPQPWLGPRR